MLVGVWGSVARLGDGGPALDASQDCGMRRAPELSFEEWEREVPRYVREDPLWILRVYRSALYAADLGRRDAALLAEGTAMGGVADQLARATGSISANLSEGYSRISPRDRSKYYEYALGSAREARDWYFQARDTLGAEVTERRLALLTSICRIVTKLISNLRSRAH